MTMNYVTGLQKAFGIIQGNHLLHQPQTSSCDCEDVLLVLLELTADYMEQGYGLGANRR